MARIFRSRWFFVSIVVLIGMVVGLGIPTLLFPGHRLNLPFMPLGVALVGWLVKKKKWIPKREEAKRPKRPNPLSILRDDSEK